MSYLSSFSKKVGALGFLCPSYPIEMGGLGGHDVIDCIMAEELSKVNAGIAASLMVQGGLSPQPIYHFGSENQKQRFLLPGIKGEKISACPYWSGFLFGRRLYQDPNSMGRG